MEVLEDRNTSLKKVLKLSGKSLKEHDEDVERIKEWIGTQPHLPSIPSYELLSNALIKSKFSIEKTKQTIDHYYTIRSLMPEMFDRSSKKIEKILNHVMEKCEYFVPMPRLTTPDGYRAIFARHFSDPNNIDPYDIINHRCAIFEIRYLKDCMVGDIHFEDLSGIQLGHMKMFTPMFVKKCVTVYEKVYNNRIKAIHLFNMPRFFQSVFNMTKGFMKPKLANRMFAHKDASNLKKYLPLECIPEEYGGTAPKMFNLNAVWRKELESFRPIFEILDKLKSEENKRPNPLINDDFLGYYGCFKQINLD